MTTEISTNFQLEIALKQKEKEHIEKLQYAELSSTEKMAISNAPVLKNLGSNKQDKIKDWNLSVIKQFISSQHIGSDKSFGIKELKDYANQNSAILALGCASTIKNCIKTRSDAQSVLDWVKYLNSKDRHLYDTDIDDILNVSAEKILSDISILHSSAKAADEISIILECISKNCSQNFLPTFQNVLRLIKKSEKLKEADKEKLYSSCLSYLRQAIEFSNESKIYSSFIIGKEHIFSIIKEIGKTADDYFMQADLNSTINNLFNIYFYTMDTFGIYLKENEKWDIFTALIPYDNTCRKDEILEIIANKVLSDSFDNFSTHYSVKIIGCILFANLPKNIPNESAKNKCIELLVEIYSLNSNKSSELEFYINECLKNKQEMREQRILLLKKLLEKYNDAETESKIKDNLFALLAKEFSDDMSFIIKNSELFYGFIEVFFTRCDEPRTLESIKVFLRSSFKDSKKSFFSYLDMNFAKQNSEVQTFILRIVSDRISEINDITEKSLFLECVRLLKEIAVSDTTVDGRAKQCAEETLIDLLSDSPTKRKEIRQYLIEIFSMLSDETEKEHFVKLLLEDFSKSEGEQKKELYNLMQSIYEKYFDIVKNFSCLKDCLKIFVDYLSNEDETSNARKSLEIFLKSNIDSTGKTGNDKKTFFDEIEDSWKSYDIAQKKRLLELIDNTLNSANYELIDALYDSVVAHFIKQEFADYKSDKKFVLQIGSKDTDSVGLSNRWFRIILNSSDSENEYDNIISILKEEILHGEISEEQRNDCYTVIKNSLRFKDDKKGFIRFSVELLKNIVK